MKHLLIMTMLVTSAALFALEQGEMAPSVELSLIGQQEVTDITIPSEGKEFVVLEFMSITCGPCIQSLPFLKMLNSSIQDNADMRMIDIDRPSQAVTDFFEDYYSKYFDLPFFVDTTQRIAARAFMIKYTPTLFIINRAGEVVYKHIGAIDFATGQHITELVNN